MPYHKIYYMQYSYLDLEVLEGGPVTAAAAPDSLGLPHIVAQALHHPHIGVFSQFIDLQKLSLI